MSDNNKDVGINNGAVKYGEADKYRYFHKEYGDDLQNLQEDIEVHQEYKDDVEEGQEDKQRQLHDNYKDDVEEGQ